MNRTPVDDVREGKPPRQRGSAQTAGNGAPKQSTQPPKRKRINPEQTARDKYEENLKRLEAQKKAQRARIIRKIRDAAVSCVLIAAVFIVMCVVVYRLLFVINDISAAGAVSNTGEEIVSASGVFEGDHLFSFSSKEVGQLITLRCPEVVEVDVERTPPGTIVFNVVEEKPTFYADFYGEYRLLSESLRVLDSVKLEDAKAMGCIRIVLPDVYNATAGLVPEFAKVRNDKYIYSVCTALVESGFAERAVSIDLRDKFDITVGIDSKYLLKLGEWESSETKLKIAAAVLEDDMFKGETKAIIDVSDLSKTSVVVDEGLTVD